VRSALCVGWVERSETHRNRVKSMAPKFHFKIMGYMVRGFAALYPSYASQT
jgi:hypothetical protein